MNLKALRMSANLTQSEVARRMNCKRTAVSMWEHGNSMPRTDKLVKLAQLFGVTLDELMGKGGADK